MAYTYQAATWCDACGEAIRKRLDEAGERPENPDYEPSYDSDDYPKGPTEDDDEADSPDHCDAGAECLNALELDDGSKAGAIVSGLTDEGIAYVRAAKNSPCVRAWRAHYDLEPIVVHLDNQVFETTDWSVAVSVSGPCAGRFASDDQTIAGDRWEVLRDDFAHAVISDHPGLVAELEKEGYTLNLDAYSPPEAGSENS